MEMDNGRWEDHFPLQTGPFPRNHVTERVTGHSFGVSPSGSDPGAPPTGGKPPSSHRVTAMVMPRRTSNPTSRRFPRAGETEAGAGAMGRGRHVDAWSGDKVPTRRVPKSRVGSK